MTLLTAALSLSDSGIIAVLGYGVVFFGLILLMIVVSIVGKLFTPSTKKVTEAPATETAAEEVPETPVAPGSAGQLKLHDVDPKIAAMLMAIVADKTGKPINELRFISIKEVK